MSTYDNDPRVRKVDEYQYAVDVGGDEWYVSPWRRDDSEWCARPYIGSKLARSANLRSHGEYQAWLNEVSRGPFGSADEAIRSLIGSPQ